MHSAISSPLDHVTFAFGPDDSYLYNSESSWARRGLEPSIERQFMDVKITEIHCVALGETKGNFFFCWSQKQAGGGSSTHFVDGPGLPPQLRKWLFTIDAAGKSLPRPERAYHKTRVVLGPNQSFVAWDDTSCRWSGVPEGMEECLQSWYAVTTGQNVIRTAALGRDGEYILVAQSGAYSCHCKDLEDKMRTFPDPVNYGWAALHYVAMSAAPGTKRWVGVFKDSFTISNLDEKQLDYIRVVDSYARPNVLEHYKKHRTQIASAVAAALRFLSYNTWQTQCDLAFSISNGTLQAFPHLPQSACVCALPACVQRKKDTTLGACRHDVEEFLKSSPTYNKAWLKQQKVKFHPDQFSRRSEPSQRAAFEKKATEMYTIIEELIAASS